MICTPRELSHSCFNKSIRADTLETERVTGEFPFHALQQADHVSSPSSFDSCLFMNTAAGEAVRARCYINILF